MNAASNPQYALDLKIDQGRLATVLRRCILECTSELCSDLVPDSVSVEIIPQRHYLANSNHFECLVWGHTDLGQPVQHCMHAKRSRFAEIEYANLVWLWEGHRFADSINRIPRPLACWVEYHLLLTESISDQTALLPWIVRFASPLGMYADRQSARMRMQRLADWLVAFQQGTFSVRWARSPAHLDDIDEALHALTAIPDLSSKDRRHMVDWLSSARSNMQSVSPVLSHGDFTARNILMDQVSVTVVDWEKPLLGRHPLYDVQAFLVNLERRLSFPLCRRHAVQELKDAFLARFIARVPFEVDEQALTVSRVVVLIHELKAEHRALQDHRIQAVLRRRQSFMRYLLAEIKRETGIG